MRRKFGFTLISRRGGVVVYTRQLGSNIVTPSGSLQGTFLYLLVSNMPRTVNGTGHTGPSEFCATSI